MSLRDQILTADDLESQIEEVPEWGVKVEIRALSGTERNAYEQSMLKIRGEKVSPNLADATSKLLVRTIFDPETSERVFTDADVANLGRKSSAVLARLFDISSKLSGLTEEDVEELVGNSDAATSGDSSSS